MKYYNIHTHSPLNVANTIEIFAAFSDFENLPKAQHYSVGFHPRFLENNATEETFELLTQLAKKHSVVAIGECGLDKQANSDFDLQMYWFEKHIQLANDVRKPLILHTVGAYEETFQLLKSNDVKVPVVFHGFNKSKELCKQILDRGYYISLGKVLLLKEKWPVFQELPLDRFVFETDASELNIEQVYALGAEMFEIEQKELMEIVVQNVNRIFNLTIKE